MTALSILAVLAELSGEAVVADAAADIVLADVDLM